MIKAIIFDLGRVIVPFEFGRAYERMEALSGIPADEIARRIGATGLVERFESGGIAPEDFAARIAAQLNREIPYGEFCEIWSSIFLPETLISEDLLRDLAARYRLVLLSNTNAIHFGMIRATFPHLGHFHACVLSYEVGAMKPSPLIYRRAVEAAGFAPEECFFTDDIAAYVAAARQEGIDAAQFRSESALRDELRARGVECPANSGNQ